MVDKVLVTAVATVWAREMMYKAAVHTVFLYGRESWLVTYVMLKILEGLHRRVSCTISVIKSRRVVEGDGSGHWYRMPLGRNICGQ